MFALEQSELEQVQKQFNLPRYRLRQLREWVFAKGVDSFAAMANLPRALRSQLAQRYSITGSRVAKWRSNADKTVKLLVVYPDGAQIEAVIMSYRGWSSACLSTQVGCAMGCRFCATGGLGLERNLSKAELAEQLWHCQRLAHQLGLRPVRNIVLMGVGEPLANFDNVVGFIEAASAPELFGIGQRRISLSTVGIVPRIYDLAQLKLGITLAVSLHAPDDDLRRQLMPTASKYPLQELLAACRKYTMVTGRRVTFEYVLLAGVNDAPAQARQLGRLLRGFNCLVNIIPYNAVPGSGFRASGRARDFQAVLTAMGLKATIRRSLGADIEAACGQLRKSQDWKG